MKRKGSVPPQWTYRRWSSRRIGLTLIPCALALWALLRQHSLSRQPPPFLVSRSPLPVHHQEDRILWTNTPISEHRPRAQFLQGRTRERPVLTIFTSTRNPREVVFQTLAAIQSQSLQLFRWVIISDNSTEPAALQRLAQLRKADSRIIVLINRESPGIIGTRNMALAFLRKDPTAFFTFLDDDDLVELTIYEKCVWMLESNRYWSFASYYWIKYGEYNLLETRGVHLGAANYHSENYVVNTAVIRTSDIGDCSFDSAFATGGEDWDFWLCLARTGKWGGTLPEIGYWYFQNPEKFRKERWGASLFGTGLGAMKARLHKKYVELAVDFPDLQTPKSVALEPITWVMPFNNILGNDKAIMVIQPWFFTGGADIGFLRIIETLARQGYRVTAVATLYKPKGGLDLRPQTMQWTHDVHILPSFLRANDQPRYLKYLIKSRNIKTVLFSNTQFIYELLPSLMEELPDVRFIDYIHNEPYDGWKTGGYVSFSIISQRYLWRTLCTCEYLKKWASERGHDPSRLGILKLGIDFDGFTPVNEVEQAVAKAEFGIRAGTLVVGFTARLDGQKRPLLLPDIAAHLRRLLAQSHTSFVILVGGEGTIRGALEDRIREQGVEGLVILAGNQEDPKRLLQAADVYLLPSVLEALSLSAAEAMATGLPVVTTYAGALPELLGYPSFPLTNGIAPGVAVNTTGGDGDALLFAKEVHHLLMDRDLRTRMGSAGRSLIQATYDWRKTLPKLEEELSMASRPSSHNTPHPAAYLAVQALLLENNPEMDLFVSQSNLRLAPRPGRGQELQDRCGETTVEHTKWLDNVLQPVPCSSSDSVNPQELFASARYQCMGWCIFDITVEHMAGWAFNGQCWMVMTRSSWCVDYISGKPVVSV